MGSLVEVKMPLEIPRERPQFYRKKVDLGGVKHKACVDAILIWKHGKSVQKRYKMQDICNRVPWCECGPVGPEAWRKRGGYLPGSVDIYKGAQGTIDIYGGAQSQFNLVSILLITLLFFFHKLERSANK